MEVVTASQYQAARIQLLEKEKALTRAKDELTRERQALPIVQVSRKYEFTDTDDNGKEVKRTLADLFDGREQLIVYHFMFEPDADKGCCSCTQAAESMHELSHLNSRGVTLVCVSRAPINKIETYKRSLGFTFPWVSSYGTPFNVDYQATMFEDDQNAQYNFTSKAKLLEKGQPWFTKGEQPGVSCFIMGSSKKGIGEDDVVYHTYSAYSRAGEAFNPTMAWLDMTKLGRRDKLSTAGGTGFRRHDEYSEDELKGKWKH